jgi:pantetheine-phosphate adenylyltransferase
MRVGIYPGSFNPWHKGHEDVLKKALEVFDRVDIIEMQNPDKETNIVSECERLANQERLKIKYNNIRYIPTTDSTLKMIVDKIGPHGIIRGLRNGHDLQYEMNQQYWNEDVGIKVPFVYFITDRALSHVSSSAIRSVNKLGLNHEYGKM